MAQVKNNSGINISRTQYLGNGRADTVSLGNSIFKGYVYNMSLEVGFNGDVTSLNLSLALDRTLKNVKSNLTVIQKRKQNIQSINSLVAIKQSRDTGNIGTTTTISQIADDDFDINENYLGINTSYNISIVDNAGNISYQLKNFRIASYSINKRDNQKILTLVMQDLSFVLGKIYVGVLGQQVALDGRSEILAIIDKLRLSCPASGPSPGGTATLKNYAQNLHFAQTKLADEFKALLPKTVDVITDTSTSSSKSNYVIIRGQKDKTIANGYGAVIILGEEDFKDAPCNSSEVLYSFKTLLAAMEALGIKIATVPLASGARVANGVDTRTLQDKSKGRIKRSYSGTLKEVLGQWCDEYSYSYAIDFLADSATTSASNSTSALSSITVQGIDLSSSLSKETVLQTKLEIETLESTSQNNNFVIKSQEFNYDLSKKNLKLYSSFYYKDAKDKSFSFENNLGDRRLYAIDLARSFPQLFSNTNNGFDFCGTGRTYNQVLMSAVLGKYSTRLRQIYNYSIGAYQALGFIPLNGDPTMSKLYLTQDINLIFQEAVTKVLDIQADILYDNLGVPMLDFRLGFYNAELAGQVERIEGFIADFIGKHYWTDVITAGEGTIANESYSASYEIQTNPPSQKVYVDQLYKIPIFQEARFLLAEINSLFNQNQNYFNAFSSFLKLKENADTACDQATAAYRSAIGDMTKNKSFRFYVNRSSAAYGAFEELLKDIQNLEYTFSGVAQKYKIDLADIYAPVFKELSPVSVATLQAAIPIDLSNCPLGNYTFGLLSGFRQDLNIFNFTFFPGSILNPIEFQNSIRERCSVISGLITAGNERNKLLLKQSCSKTILYTTCVQPNEENVLDQNSSAQLQAISPTAYNCQAVKITRRIPPDLIIQSNINRLLVTSPGFVTLQSSKLGDLLIQEIRNTGAPRKLSDYKEDIKNNGNRFETIVLPAQNDPKYQIRLISKTTSEIYLPFKNFIKGGLEDSGDLVKIIENDGFSMDLFINNITPNIRELYADQTVPSYQSSQALILDASEDKPFIMDYQGYSDEATPRPKYEFQSFEAFHNALKAYYNSKALSYNQPNVTYSVDLFCSYVDATLKNLISVNKGLSKMNLSIGESGLNIQLTYQSSPAKPLNMETLVYKNKPNIKLVNTNFFK
jgi:hypothetical protein